MHFPPIPGWDPPLVVVGGPLPILAEGPGCSSPPYLAGICSCGVAGGALCVFVVCDVCVVVCGVLFVIPAVVPSVFVSVWV